MNSRRSWLMFGIGVFAYMTSILGRTSLGVAAVDATERFQVQAAVLSSLAVVQIIVYAGLQIPIGVMVDRVGPKVLIATGAGLIALGQLIVSIAPNITVAIVGRILVGAGDAMTFLPLQRVIASWFSGRNLPIISQVLGTTGQLGQLLSAVPFALVLHSLGWEPAFISAAGVAVLSCVLIVVLLSNAPVGAEQREVISLRLTGKHLRDALARPGTQLGFWSHYVLQPSITMFVLLWGFPFLSVGLGYGPGGASALLTLVVIVSIISGPILGLLTARFPFRRSNVVLGLVVSMALAWTLVLAWPGVPPVGVVVLLIVVISIGGPGSIIGFDFARTFNPARSLGSATGFVNVGGFLATLVIMFFIGVVLDVLDGLHGGTGDPAELYAFSSFRIAFLVVYVVVGVGVVFLLRARRATHRKLRDDEGITVAPLWVALVRRWRKARA